MRHQIAQVQQQFRGAGRLRIRARAQVRQHLLAGNARIRLQIGQDFANDLRGGINLDRRWRNRSHKSFAHVHLEQIEPHLPEGRLQRHHQGQRKATLLLPGKRHCRPQRLVIKLTGLGPRHNAARRLPQHALDLAPHPLLGLRAGQFRGLLPLRRLFQAEDGFLALTFLPLFDQRLIAHGLQTGQIVGLRHMRVARRPQLLNPLVIAMMIRRPQQLAAQAAARHHRKVARRRLDLGFLDLEKLVKVVAHDMRLGIVPMTENPPALETLAQGLTRLALGGRRHLQLDQIAIGMRQKAAGNFQQRIGPAAGPEILRQQVQALAIRQKHHLHIEPGWTIPPWRAVPSALWPLAITGPAPRRTGSLWRRATAVIRKAPPTGLRVAGARASARLFPASAAAPWPFAPGPIATRGPVTPAIATIRLATTPVITPPPRAPAARRFRIEIRPAGIGIVGRFARPSRHEIQFQDGLHPVLFIPFRTILTIGHLPCRLPAASGQPLSPGPPLGGFAYSSGHYPTAIFPQDVAQHPRWRNLQPAAKSPARPAPRAIGARKRRGAHDVPPEGPMA